MSDPIQQDVKMEVEQKPELESSATQNDLQQQEEPSVSKSREDVNTQTENKIPEGVTEKSANRFQELANENKHLKSLREQDLERISQFQAQLRAAQSNNPNEVLSRKTAELQTDIYNMQENQKWDKAVRAVPELESDKDLENLVYSQYLARREYEPSITPELIAKEMVGYLEKKSNSVKKQTYEQAENDISQKLSSQISPRSSSQKSNNSEDLFRKAEEGDEDAITALFK